MVALNRGLKTSRVRKKHNVYMKLAFDVSSLSTCASRQVGCVVVGADGYVSAVTYNGAAHGEPHCFDKRTGCNLDERGACIDSIHAEENAIIHLGSRMRGAQVYTTHRPCKRCTRKLVQAGIAFVYYADGQLEIDIRRIFDRHGINYFKYPEEI